MSRHPILPPLAYVAEPKPKKIENRKRRLQAGGAGTFDGMDEAGETGEATAASQSTPAFNKPAPQNFPAIEGSDSKPQHPRGRLSEDTLKAMLQTQELRKGAQTPGTASSKRCTLTRRRPRAFATSRRTPA